jgi:hypothetical protein
VELEYCSIEDMVEDYFTKPLQGKKFIKLKNLSWGRCIRCMSDTLNECVGLSIQIFAEM